jgi:hypothetical protein
VLSRRDKNVIIMAARGEYIGAWAVMHGRTPPKERGEGVRNRVRYEKAREIVLAEVEAIKERLRRPTGPVRPATKEEVVARELRTRMSTARQLLEEQLAELDERESEIFRERKKIEGALEHLRDDDLPEIPEEELREAAEERKPKRRHKVTPEMIRDWIVENRGDGEPFTTGEIVDGMEISRVSVNRHIEPLVDRVIAREGSGSGTKYRYLHADRPAETSPRQPANGDEPEDGVAPDAPARGEPVPGTGRHGRAIPGMHR